MTGTIRWMAALMVAASLCCPAATIIVVRHAERADGGMSTDVPLSAAGEARAKELARVLKDAGVNRIFTTDLQRTRQTAAPLAARLQVTPVAIRSADVDGLVKALRGLKADDIALVVGHSNTVPAIVERMTGVKAPAIADTEFDRMFVVNTAGKRAVVALRYGAE